MAYMQAVKQEADPKALEATKRCLLWHRDDVAKNFLQTMSPTTYDNGKANWKTNWTWQCAIGYIATFEKELNITIASKASIHAKTFLHLFKSLFLPVAGVPFAAYLSLGLPALPASDWNINNRPPANPDVANNRIPATPDVAGYSDWEDEYDIVGNDSGSEVEFI